MSKRVLDEIIGAARLKVCADSDGEQACRRVLNDIATRLAFRICDGPHLSKRNDLRPMLKAWRTWSTTGSAAAGTRLEALHGAVKGKGGYPAPSLKQRSDFEEWLADEAVAHKIEDDLVERCLCPVALERARDKAARVGATRETLGIAEPSLVTADLPRDLVKGGRPKERDFARRVEALLAIFWLLFKAAPNSSVALARPRAPSNAREPDSEDGGAAARFIAAFEGAVESAIKDAGIVDPLVVADSLLFGVPLQKRTQARPRTWKSNSIRATAQQIDQCISARGHVWERWTLAITKNKDGGVDAMLVRKVPCKAPETAARTRTKSSIRARIRR